MTAAYRRSLIAVLLCMGLSVIWGTYGAHSKAAYIDFRAVYAGTRCLLHGHNPYNVGDVEREYLSEDGHRPSGSPFILQVITLYVNVPPAFVFVAPFAALHFDTASFLWVLLTGIVFFSAVLLVWDTGMRSAPDASTLLACILAANCESLFSGGNTGGLVVGFCVIAAWCLLSDRLPWLAVVCLGLSLAIKPHDAGFVWLFFLLAGGTFRKRALQSLAITAAMSLIAVIWLGHVAPHWMQDWRTNLGTISMRGGINEPSPNAVTGHMTPPVVDLQAAISVFRDVPHFYNSVAYAVCGLLLLAWAIWTLRSRFSPARAWVALAAAAALTMLITYHREWDAKLVMLAIVPCCRMRAAGGRLANACLLITVLAVVFTADIPLMFFNSLYDTYGLKNTGVAGHLLALFLLRPASIMLLAMAGFYLWIYRTPAEADVQSATEVHA